MTASATATWAGTLDEGSGTVSTATGLEGTFTRASRFDDGKGTNPEELIGAAHAAASRRSWRCSCRTMTPLQG